MPNEKNKKAILYTLLEIVAVLVICIVSGAFDWVKLSFSWAKVSTWEYWRDVIQKFLMYTAALFVGYFFKMEKLELKDNEYANLLLSYRELLKSKYESFIEYIETIYNPETKRKFIKVRADKKLLTLDKLSKSAWKLEYNKAIKSGNFDNFQWSSKWSKKYAIRRKRLTEMSDINFIEENWEYISIRYPIISPHVFTYNLKNSDINNAEYRVSNKTAKDFLKIVGRKIIKMFLWAFIVALFAMNPSANELLEMANGWITVIIQYVFRVFMIVFNFVWGLFCGKQMFINNFILPLQNRIRILKLYIDWCKKENKPLTYSDELMNTYRDREAQETRLTNLLDLAQDAKDKILKK